MSDLGLRVIQGERKEKLLFTKEEREEVANNNTALFYDVAWKFQREWPMLEYEDLESAAQEAYIKGINSYDKNNGAAVSTYIVTCVTNALRDETRKQMKHFMNTTSMSSKISDTKEYDSLDIGGIASNNVIGDMEVELGVLLEEDIGILLGGVDKLHPREKFIIENRYGINGKIPKSQSEIAEMLNRTQPSISLAEKQALKKLRIFLEGKITLERTEYYNGGVMSPIMYVRPKEDAA